MNEFGNLFLAFASALAMAMLVVALFLALIRLAKGPTLPDRVMALDLVGAMVVCMIAVYSVAIDNPEFLDAGFVVALIGFLSTVAFAKFIEKGLSR